MEDSPEPSQTRVTGAASGSSSRADGLVDPGLTGHHPLSPEWRRAALKEMAAAPLELLVVGGGITGAGVARDAALRGMRVGLVERSDFASGTSSRSSKIIHGG
ncbi:MAG: FAD-dependent oxidoreductase, partial [Gemmatimonadetes bacterium]|nr:FAD-dependent oxidoreductase [Gemmatimonadota bacterium]